MGKCGSDVTKKAADIIIMDDHFATIEHAVEEGRRIGSNVVKFVCHLMSGNVAEVLILMLGLSFVGANGRSVYPLATLQILWINMITSTPPVRCPCPLSLPPSFLPLLFPFFPPSHPCLPYVDEGE